MTRAPQFGRFPFQVRLVLVLLVLFLAVLDVMNLRVLNRTRRALERSERERVAGVASDVVREIGREAILQAVSGASGAPRLTPSSLRRRALRSGLTGIRVLDRAGREIAASDLPGGGRGSRFDALAVPALSDLAAGRVVTGGMDPAAGGEGARIPSFVPVLDGSGRLQAVVEAWMPVPRWGALERTVDLVVAAQLAGVLLIAALAVLFANWVSGPYRKLAAAAGEAGLAPSGGREESEPARLAEAFRGVVAKLREQEEALGALGKEGGGLGDLVRFASGPARNMSTGVLVVDRKVRVAGYNPAAAELLGRKEDELRGVPLARAASPVAGLALLVESCMGEGRGASREVLDVRSRDGGRGHVGVAVSPVTTWNGETAGALVLATDLTEIRQLQQQARLRENLAAVGRLSAGIAHEVRNALGTILGYARMIQKRGDPAVREPAEEILREVDSVRAVLDEFLLYARPPEPTRGPVDLESVARACATSAPDRVDVDVSGRFGTVWGDEALVRRVFGNLVQNAAEATEDARRRVRVRITGTRLPGERVVQVEVDDDGPGIPPDKLDQVFVPFFTTRSRGTGLGLALVQRTILDMGGNVEAFPGTRGGALFRIRLPLRRTTG